MSINNVGGCVVILFQYVECRVCVCVCCRLLNATDRFVVFLYKFDDT